MALSMAPRVPLERIEDRARRARPGRAALVVIAGVLFGLGWLACRSCSLAWLSAAWCGAAVTEGWLAARAGQRHHLD